MSFDTWPWVFGSTHEMGKSLNSRCLRQTVDTKWVEDRNKCLFDFGLGLMAEFLRVPERQGEIAAMVHNKAEGLSVPDLRQNQFPNSWR